VNYLNFGERKKILKSRNNAKTQGLSTARESLNFEIANDSIYSVGFNDN